jgi:hypothetical protein
MHARREKSKGTTQCPYCSLVVNNYNISRHIARHHTQRDAASTVTTQPDVDPYTPPPNNDEMNVREEPECFRPLGSNVSLSSDENDSDIEDASDIEEEIEDDEDDEAEMTVEDYLRDLTDETYRTDIQYDPKRVLKYLL